MAAKNYSDEELIELWKDPKFSGCYSGVANFQSALEFEKQIKVSKKKLFQVLRRDPDFSMESRRIKKVAQRRRMVVHGFGQVFQVGSPSHFATIGPYILL